MKNFCFICDREFNTVSFVIFHLKNEHFLSEAHGLKLKCLASKTCKKLFSTFSSLSRHSKSCIPPSTESNISFKKTKNDEATPSEHIANSINGDFNVVNDTGCNNLNVKDNYVSSPNDNPVYEPPSIQHKSEFSLFSSLSKQLSSCGVSEKNAAELLKTFRGVCQQSFNDFENYLLEMHSEIDINQFKLNCFNFRKKFDADCNKYSSKFKRDKQNVKGNFYVAPVSRSLGGRWVVRKTKKYLHSTKHFVQSTFQYIPILETLEKLFKNQSFKDLYFASNHVCDNKRLVSFCCSENFSNSVFFKEEKNALQIQIFYDDFETTNPLGSKTGVHKIGAIYFTIRNLPFHYNSKTSNIHLVALFLCKDLKNDDVSFNKVLQPLINDLKALETVGIKVGNTFLKGTLVSVAHDNLGGNVCFGFVESFRALNYCRFCKIHRDDAKHAFVQRDEYLRTQAEYDELLSLSNTPFNHKLTKGIKQKSEFNKLAYYKIFESLNVDVMHDILEGAVPFILKLFFQNLIKNKCLSMDEINAKILNFNYGYLQSSCKPSLITVDKKCRTSIGLTASQNLCLILHFPLIFHDIQDRIPDMWTGVISLIRIINILMTTSINKEFIETLKTEIQIHLTSIVNDFGETLLPKHHFMTHYPSVINKLGPLIHTWAMRYESKHREFIREVPVINNFKNICKTLANRYQTKTSVKWETACFKNTFVFGKMFLIDINDLNFEVQTYFYNNFGQTLESKVSTTNKFDSKYGYNYRKSFILYLKKQNDFFMFGKIKEIYVVDKEPYFLLDIYISKELDMILNLYEISAQNISKILSFKEIKYVRPYESYTINSKEYLLTPDVLAQ